MKGPLDGIRILEVGHMLAGPYCCLLLADLGADVIKIESAEGDIARHASPYFVDGHSTYFASLNRNKRSVVLDLASGEGQASFREMVKTAKALVTNLRPPAINKLGLTYEALKDVNSALVCVALTGFGLDGPYSDRPAYDYTIQAMTGVMQITGEPDAPPTRTGYSAVDNSAGIMAAFGLCAKLLEGRGGQIDIAMYDTMLSQINYIASATLNSGIKSQRIARSAHPFIVPAQVFETANGWLVLFVTHDEFWGLFAQELGRPEWLSDERFATMNARSNHRKLVVDAIAEELKRDDAVSWARRLIPLGVVAAAVATLEEALSSEQTSFRNMIVDIETPEGTITAVGNPVKVAGYREQYRISPHLGEHQFLVKDKAG